MSDSERYQYLIDKIIELRKVWLLKADEGMYAMLEDNNGQEYIPVWPEEKHTKAYIQDDWVEYQTEEMKIYDLINWMKELSDDKIKIAAFPDENFKIIPIDPLEIKNHLTTELAKR